MQQCVGVSSHGVVAMVVTASDGVGGLGRRRNE